MFEVMSMVLQNYQSFIEMTSNMIYIVALGGGFKCPRKLHSNTQGGPNFALVNKITVIQST
jgi:radical SAM superfamily enzyme